MSAKHISLGIIVAFSLALIGCASTSDDRNRGLSDPLIRVPRNFDIDKERLRAAGINPGAKSAKQAMLIVYGSGNEINRLQDQEGQQILNQFFDVKTVRITNSYDEDDLYQYWLERWNRGIFFVSYDAYLLRKNRPFSEFDILTLHKLGVKNTPAIFVFRKDGAILYEHQGRIDFFSDSLLKYLNP